MIGNQFELADCIAEHNETAQNLINKKSTQEDRILEYLQSGRSLTAIEAFKMFNCFRLASRISNIKRQGFDIKSETVSNGNGKHYARYFLKG